MTLLPARSGRLSHDSLSDAVEALPTLAFDSVAVPEPERLARPR